MTALALDNLHVLNERKSPESYIDVSTAGSFFDPLASMDMLYYTGRTVRHAQYAPFCLLPPQIMS